MLILNIAKTGLRRGLRQPLFYILVGLFAILIFLAQFFILFTFGKETTMLSEVGLSCLLMCGLVLSIFLSAESISAEEEFHTLAMLLVRPVKHSQIIMGKFLGTVLTTFIAISILAVEFLIIMVVKGKSIEGSVIISVVAAYAQSALTAAIAILFSTFVPFAVNMVSCCLLFLAGNILPAMLSEQRFLSAVVLSVIPNFFNFNFTTEIALRTPVSIGTLLWTLLYACAYIYAVLAVAALILRAREFK
ncbi:MAG: ABC transporter permease subunit [Planctomycetota bacterium]